MSWFKWIINIGVVGLLMLGIVNGWMIYNTYDSIYQNNIPQTDQYKVALVLGTSKRKVGGGENSYFSNRMKAAVQLFEEGKVKHIIVSGDNETRYYNEPKDMQQSLIDMGIPPERITLDYAGFRTLDSIVRCKEVFDQQSVIIITQRFHSYRALFIADFYQLDAIAFEANDPDDLDTTMVELREVFARAMAVLDLYFLETPPRFLGEKIPIDID